MDKIKKIHFKATALTSQQLLQKLQTSLASLDIPLFIHKNNFKYFPHFVEQLHSSFTKAALLYSITKRFPALTDNENIDCVALSQQLKEQYTALNLKTLTKKDSFFYFLCIYFTKLATNFLENTFVDILVESHLQSQLYISLVHVMIGLQVSPKSYEINHRKFISAPLTFPTKTYLMSKADSIQSAVQRLSNRKVNNFPTPSKRVQSKFTLQRKATHVFKTQTPSETDSFKSVLKQNLVVDVLPQIPIKKLKAAEFDKITQLNQLRIPSSEANSQLLRSESQLISGQTFLFSTQNSTSYEMYFRNNDQNICNMHKTVKISHRPQLIQTAGRKIQKLIMNTVHVEQPQKNEKQCESDCSRKNWEHIVRNIKLNTVYTTKHNSKSAWAEGKENEGSLASTTSLNSQPTTYHVLETQANVYKKKHLNGRASTNGFLSQPRHLTTQFYEHKERAMEVESSEGFQRQKSQKYRVQRKQFESQCSNRHLESAYSSFNPANMNNNFVKFGLTHK